LTNNAQNVRFTLLWRNELLDLIAEENHTDFIVIGYRRKGKDCAYFSNNRLFKLLYRAEIIACRYIYHEDNSKLAFFFKNFDVRCTQACSNIPVNGAHFVAHTVFTHFAKRHSASLESRVVLARKNLIGQSLRL